MCWEEGKEELCRIQFLQVSLYKKISFHYIYVNLRIQLFDVFFSRKMLKLLAV